MHRLYLREGTSKCKWSKKGEEIKAVGRTVGGLNTKLHAIVDGLGNPVELLLSARNDYDSIHAVALLSKTSLQNSNILGDRAYGTGEIREYIAQNGAKVVIPSKKNTLEPWEIVWCL